MSLFLLWHMALSSLFGLTFAIIFGALNSTTSILALIIGAIASYFVSRADAVSKSLFISPQGRTSETLWIERIAVAFVMYLSYRHFVYLLYEVGAEYRTLNANNFGDLPLHINYIRMIANGVSFPWLNPEFADDLLRYPLGIDLYNALWEGAGVRLQAHLFFVAMIGVALTVRFARLLASWWGVIGLFLSGGFVGWFKLAGYHSELAWKNIFLAVIVTQRGFLFALPAGMYLLMRARKPEKLSWTFGLLWGLLPFFHLHSFVIVSLLLAGEALIRRDVKRFFAPLATAVPIGSAFIFYSTQSLKSSGFVRWQPGWMNEGNLLLFLNVNFGPYLYFAIGSLIYFTLVGVARRLKKPEFEKTYVYLWFYFAIFALFFNLMLAPWAWDNIKILIWPYLLILSCWSQLNSQLKVRGVQILLAGILGFSGFYAVAPSLLTTASAVTLYLKGDLANAESALKDVPKDAIFLASTTHNHPLTYFGRVRALGYAGHLWSHGIDASENQKKMERIIADDPAWRDLAKELRVTHIYWGREEQTQYGHQIRSWQKPENNVSKVNEISIYEVK